MDTSAIKKSGWSVTGLISSRGTPAYMYVWVCVFSLDMVISNAVADFEKAFFFLFKYVFFAPNTSQTPKKRPKTIKTIVFGQFSGNLRYVRCEKKNM